MSFLDNMFGGLDFTNLGNQMQAFLSDALESQKRIESRLARIEAALNIPINESKQCEIIALEKKS